MASAELFNLGSEFGKYIKIASIFALGSVVVGGAVVAIQNRRFETTALREIDQITDPGTDLSQL